jgi:hypothetical protein
MLRIVAAACIGVLTLIGTLHSGPQVRDLTSRSNEMGTARIAGVVLAVHGPATGVPSRRAIVTITGSTLPVGRSVVTDDGGRFVLDRLPPGRFMLIASKPTYLNGSYGATRPGRPGVPLVLADGDRLADVTLVVTRGAAIGGTVRDTTSAPVAGAPVSVFRMLPDGTLAAAGTATSDDRGAYRLFGLTAGNYLVSALPIARGAGDATDLGSEAIDRKLAALKARGGGAPAGPQPSTPRVPVGMTTFAQVFHPRAFSPADAATVTLAFGDDRASVDIVLDRVRSLVVDGMLAGAPDGAAITIAMSPAGPGPQAPLAAPTLQSRPPGNGPFRFTNVAPGRYVVLARTQIGAQPVLWARAEIDANGGDVGGVTLALQPALRLTGQIVFEATTLAPPADLTTVQVLLTDATPRSGGAGRGRGSGPQSGSTTDARGRFEIRDVLPGTYLITTSFPSDPAGWWLRSAVLNGRDLLDLPLAVDPSTPLADAVLTFSDRHATLSGTLEVPAGRAASEFHIVVFPEDRSFWLPRARRIRSARPGTDGTYVLRDLPPGAYRLAALTDLSPDDLLDASFFTSILPASIRVSIADGEQKVQSLRVGSGGFGV